MARQGSFSRLQGPGVDIRMEFTPDRSIVENIRHMRERVLTNVTVAAALAARQMQSFARDNAPWEDQPDSGPIPVGVDQHVHQPPRYPGPHAREGITTGVIRSGEVVGVNLSMSPSVVANAGKGEYAYGEKLIRDSGHFEDVAEEFAPAFVDLVAGAAIVGFRARGRR